MCNKLELNSNLHDGEYFNITDFIEASGKVIIKYFLTNDLMPSSSSTTSICAINLSIYNFT